MTVDLSKLQAGDTVEFLCGGRAVIENLIPLGDSLIEVDFEGYSAFFDYRKDGTLSATVEGPFDIIAIHKKPFDWANVKAGDKFKYTNSNALGRLEFVAMHPYSDGTAICVNLEAVDKHTRQVPIDSMEPDND
jgi:hypothetical protein